MTLLIAFLLIDHMQLSEGWKVWATVLWIGHLMFHSAPGKDSIATEVAKKLRQKGGA